MNKMSLLSTVMTAGLLVGCSSSNPESLTPNEKSFGPVAEGDVGLQSQDTIAENALAGVHLVLDVLGCEVDAPPVRTEDLSALSLEFFGDEETGRATILDGAIVIDDDVAIADAHNYGIHEGAHVCSDPSVSVEFVPPYEYEGIKITGAEGFLVMFTISGEASYVNIAEEGVADLLSRTIDGYRGVPEYTKAVHLTARFMELSGLNLDEINELHKNDGILEFAAAVYGVDAQDLTGAQFAYFINEYATMDDSVEVPTLDDLANRFRN